MQTEQHQLRRGDEGDLTQITGVQDHQESYEQQETVKSIKMFYPSVVLVFWQHLFRQDSMEESSCC